MPAPPLESLPAMVSAQRMACGNGYPSERAARGCGRLSEHEQELEGRNDFACLQLESGGLCGSDDGFRLDAILRGWSGSACPRQEIDHPYASLRLEYALDVLEK